MKTYFAVVLLVTMMMFAGLAGFAEKAAQTQVKAHERGTSAVYVSRD